MIDVQISLTTMATQKESTYGLPVRTLFANKAFVDCYISQEPDNHLRLSSSLKRYDHLYNLTVTYKDGVTKKEREQTFKK